MLIRKIAILKPLGLFHCWFGWLKLAKLHWFPGSQCAIEKVGPRLPKAVSQSLGDTEALSVNGRCDLDSSAHLDALNRLQSLLLCSLIAAVLRSS